MSGLDLTPGSPEWTKRMTASKVAAVLGVSPWQSPRSLWHEMRGDVPRPESNDAQRRGHYLEPAVLNWFTDQHDLELDGLLLQPTYALDNWAAATPDAVTINMEGGNALVEAKSVAYDDEWGDEGTDAIPDYYLVQCQWQMHVSGIHRCYVPIITSRLRFAEYVVDYSTEYGPLLEARCREFYDSLSADVPPDLDDSVATFQTLKALHPDIERGESVELTEDEAWTLAHANVKADEWETRLRGKKSALLDRMGRAQYATHNGVRIARRQGNKTGVSLVVTAKPADLTTEENVA